MVSNLFRRVEMLNDIFKEQVKFSGNFIDMLELISKDDMAQTANAFSEKWVSYAKDSNESDQQKLWDFQKEWYLKLYGFNSERHLAEFLQQQKIVFDAGCGLGYLTEWFARLAPKTTIVGMDISDSVEVASRKYQNLSNAYFIKGDISKTPFKDNTIDYVSCHAVIMHTQNPEDTFQELTRILKPKSCGGGGNLVAISMQKKHYQESY